MPRMHILTPAEFNAFERPPAFSHVERQRFFDLSPRFEHLLSSFRTPTNQICFVLALGYFRATKRFFARQFREADAEYVTQQLGMLPGMFDLRSYKETTARSHRKLILDYLGFQPFNTQARQHLAHEIHTLIRSQVRPKAMFLYALDVLARRKTEIPSAYLLTDLIVHEIRRHKGTLTEVIDAQISEELRALLEALLEKTEGSVDTAPELQRFKLTLLKKISQSTKPARIRATLEDWQTLRRLYDEMTPMIATLDLTHDGIRYYANAVLKSQVFQVSRRADEDRHLHLVCFIAHQFYRLQDTLIDILLTSVQTALNACTRHHKEQYYAARTDQRRALVAFVDTVDKGAFSPLQAIEAIVFNPELSDPDKVQRIQSVLTERSSERDTAQEKFVSFKAQTQRQSADAEYYDVLASQSRKLQNRVAEIVKVLAFEGDEASDLMAAMQQYKAKDGQITQAAPLGFLESEEQEAVLDETGDIHVSLYKALLFAKIAEALKGGVLNLPHSYKYRSLDDYLIPKDDWQAHRHDYLQRANLTAVADCESTLNALATRLDTQYHQTNRHILAEENPHVHFRKDGSFHVSTPKADPEDSEPLLSVLPTRRYVSLLEVLATVNRFTHFLDAFEPWRVQYARTKPPDRTFFAGITGYGCFIGTRKMASISSGIAESELESTVNGYFTLDNVHSANDRILEFMDQLSLPQVYRQPGEPLHTSSEAPRPQGGASYGQVGTADYRPLRPHLP